MKLFGTDGIRGRANIFPMTADTVVKVGQALGLLLEEKKQKKVLIGKDPRLSSYMFEQAIAAGLMSTGVEAMLVGPMPTPAISYLTESMRAQAGVMISASHNPYEDNGIKIFGPDGFKLSDENEAFIEDLVENSLKIEKRLKADVSGKAYRIEDAKGRYISHLKYNFPKAYDLIGYKIVIDCANGAAYKIAPTVFEELGAQCIIIENQPNGTNINKNCGAVYPQRMQNAVLEHKADYGICLDGDADRIVMCDENGAVLDGDDLLFILVSAMVANDNKPQGIVGTLMSNMALENYCNDNGIQFLRAKVGDRYVVEKMRENKWSLGGESSGHIIYLPNCNTGDGIMNALLIAAVLCQTGNKLSEIAQSFNKYPQEMINVEVKEKKPLESCVALSKSIERAKKNLNGEGRVLVRYSGTENKLRIMVEAHSENVLKEQLKKLVSTAKSELS
ncbi:phosphoglucosamine mutase [bacterium]|nr:phosphoglucosamine mutase [bacterium]